MRKYITHDPLRRVAMLLAYDMGLKVVASPILEGKYHICEEYPNQWEKYFYFCKDFTDKIFVSWMLSQLKEAWLKMDEEPITIYNNTPISCIKIIAAHEMKFPTQWKYATENDKDYKPRGCLCSIPSILYTYKCENFTNKIWADWLEDTLNKIISEEIKQLTIFRGIISRNTNVDENYILQIDKNLENLQKWRTLIKNKQYDKF